MALQGKMLLLDFVFPQKPDMLHANQRHAIPKKINKY